MSQREQIARIIDPFAFVLADDDLNWQVSR